MGKTMSVVSLFKFILFFALVKMFYSLLDYIKKNRAIEKSVYRIYSTADERYEKRKEQKEKIYFEEGNVENTSFFYRLDLLIERSEIRKKIPFLSTEIYLLFLGIISVIAFVIGNLIFGLIGAVLGITLSILIIHSSLYILARLNYERVDKSIQAVLLAGDYDSEKQTDGTVPWADSFSIYRLLMKNGNSVVHYLIKGKDTSHAEMPHNKQAINYIKVFFYE